jgi:hypothetical protein
MLLPVRLGTLDSNIYKMHKGSIETVVSSAALYVLVGRLPQQPVHIDKNQ